MLLLAIKVVIAVNSDQVVPTVQYVFLFILLLSDIKKTPLL